MALCKEYLLIFDWDGVIVNSASYYMEVYRKICIKYNKDFSVKTLDDFKEWYDSEWENNFYNLGFSKEELPEILKYENKIVNYGEIDFFKNIKEILLKLSETFSMAIASNDKL